MAAIAKYADVAAACRILIHNNRNVNYHSCSNPDIVPQLSRYNYSLSQTHITTP